MWIGKLGFGVAVAVAVFFWVVFATQYFQWSACFNTAGRCFDPETGVVYHEQSGIAWLALALLATCIAFYQLWRLLR